jgi:hypothetical protein
VRRAGETGVAALAELRKSDAGGEVAAIYAEIRRLWGVPYVSSLQLFSRSRLFSPGGWVVDMKLVLSCFPQGASLFRASAVSATVATP